MVLEVLVEMEGYYMTMKEVKKGDDGLLVFCGGSPRCSWFRKPLEEMN